MTTLQKKFSATVLVLALAIAPAALAQTALVWGSGNGNGGNTQSVADYVAQYGCFTSVTASDEVFLPLGTLLSYNAVLYFSNVSATQDPVAIGDVLADYADTGQRLIIATFSWANQGANTLGGRIITDQISPLLVGGTSLYSDVTMASNDGSAFFAGVNAINGNFHDDVVLTTGAVERGTWSDGEPLLATKGNVVGINLFPDASWGNLTGDYAQLFGNAMCNGPVAVEQATWGGVKALFR
jgi:hypothetical protein